MFTGIIEGAGTLTGKRVAGGGGIFTIEAGFDLTDPAEGESIAINGVCLTAYNIRGRHFSVDVSPETLDRTRLGNLVAGDTLNLERALKLSDRFGGHIVSGHVDCVASAIGVKSVGDYVIYSFSLPKEQGVYVIEKGSIAIDGVSLTVNTCEKDSFSVSIIPHTLKITTLARLKIGSKVNIEVDIIGKYVEKLLSPRTETSGVVDEKGIDPEFLAQHGFF